MGGYDSFPVSFIYNLDEDQWTRLPDMNFGRSIASCGMAIGGPDGPEFVVAGTVLASSHAEPIMGLKPA